MHRLARLARSDMGTLALWAVTAALAVVAALAGWGLVLALAIAVNYAADARLFQVDERALQWLNKRQLASAQRAFLRQASAVLGWAVITGPEPQHEGDVDVQRQPGAGDGGDRRKGGRQDLGA